MGDDSRDIAKAERDRRLAAALRENLRRRKAQARERRSDDRNAPDGAVADGASERPKSSG